MHYETIIRNGRVFDGLVASNLADVGIKDGRPSMGIGHYVCGNGYKTACSAGYPWRFCVGSAMPYSNHPDF